MISALEKSYYGHAGIEPGINVFSPACGASVMGMQVEWNIRRTQLLVMYEAAVAALEELLAKKKAIQSEELLRLFAGSNKSYEEVVAFFKEGIPEEQLASNTRKKPGRKPKTRV